MKHGLLLSFLLLLTIGVAAQTSPRPAPPDTTTQAVAQDTVRDFMFVDVQPQFPGGDSAWKVFVQKNMHYPQMAKESNTEGTVFVHFIVEKDGTISNITCQSNGKANMKMLENEAYRIVARSPQWKPGMKNGQAVRCRMMQPIVFSLR